MHEFSEHFSHLASQTSIPIAIGERIFTKYDFKKLFAESGIGILQPDLSYAGNISEYIKYFEYSEIK